MRSWRDCVALFTSSNHLHVPFDPKTKVWGQAACISLAQYPLIQERGTMVGKRKSEPRLTYPCDANWSPTPQALNHNSEVRASASHERRPGQGVWRRRQLMDTAPQSQHPPHGSVCTVQVTCQCPRMRHKGENSERAASLRAVDPPRAYIQSRRRNKEEGAKGIGKRW